MHTAELFSIVFVVLLLSLHNGDARVVSLLTSDAAKTRLIAVDKGLEFLKGLTGPVALVSFIGRARTGKSFGLNELLNVSHDRGFQIGHTYKPETSGVLLWSEPFPGTGPGTAHPTTVLVADTEGLDSGINSYETALLLVVASLSSRLEYHVTEYVYLDDVIRLHGLASFVEHLDKRGVRGTATLPHITWLVHKRNLVKNPGQTDMDVLMQTWLAERPNADNSDTIASFNSTVRVVKTAFSEHHVHLIPTAAPPGIECSDLGFLPFSDLSPGYLAGMDRVRAEIVLELPRTIQASASAVTATTTGSELADILEMILPSANEGVQDVGDRVADAIVRRHAAETRLRLANAIDELKYPMEEAELDVNLTRLENDAVEHLRNGMSSAPTSALSYVLSQHERDLKEKFADERRRARMRNEAASDVVCASAERLASEGLTRRAITHNDTVRTDVNQFDVTVEIAKRLYMRNAVGPMRERYYDVLEIKAKSMREVIIAETAPMRRISWAFGSLLVLVVLQIVRTVLGWIKCRASLMFQALVFVAQLVAVAVGIIAVWSYVGNPAIKLEYVIELSESATIWMQMNSLAVALALGAVTCGLVLCNCH